MKADDLKDTTKKFLAPDTASASFAGRCSLQSSPLALQKELAKPLSSSGH